MASLLLPGVILIAAAPLVAHVPAPLHDWPSHLARVHILSQMLAGPSLWDRFYAVTTFFVPNAALDVGVLGLMRLGLGLDAASQVFLLATFALFVGGFLALCRGFGTAGPIRVLLACFLFYQTALFWGFVNYLFGLGLALLCAGLWLRAEARPATKLAIAVLGTASVFFCHVIAAVSLVAIMGSVDAASLLRRPRLRLAAAHLTSLAGAATAATLLALSPTSSDHLLHVIYGGGSAAGFVKAKLRWAALALLGGGAWHDIFTLVALATLVAALALAARPRWSRAGAAAFAATLLMFLAAPEAVGRGALLDARIAVLPLVIAAASVRFAWRSIRAEGLVLGLFAALMVARAGLAERAWERDAVALRGWSAEAASLPRGSTLVSAWGRLGGSIPWFAWWTPPVMQFAAQAARYDVFTPSVFADPTQQPLALKPEFRGFEDPLDLSSPASLAMSLARLPALCARMRPGPVYMLLTYPTALTEAAIPDRLTLWRGPKMQLVDACRAATQGGGS